MSIQYILDRIHAKEQGYRVAGLSPEFQPTYYRAKVFPALSKFRKRPGFKFVIEKLWVGWHTHYESPWFKDKEVCERMANHYLDDKEPKKDAEIVRGKS